MTKRFEGKVALVTAAADGIGAATATALAHEGAQVMLSDINEDAGQVLADTLRSNGAKAAFLKTDASSEQDIERLVALTVERFGGLDTAVNVVGAAHPESVGAEFHLQSKTGWNSTLALTMDSVFLSMKHEIAQMLNNGGGTICNVSSLAGLSYIPDGGMAYAAAKAAVIRMTKFAAATYADRNIRVNCVALGVTLSAAYQRFDPEEREAMMAVQLEQHVIKRGIEPSEQADSILFLCSKEAAMITGHTLPVDGGWAARF